MSVATQAFLVSLLLGPGGDGAAPSVPAAPAPAPPPGSAWTLDDCYQAALARSERIGRAAEDVELARAEKRLARGAILPRLGLEDNYFRQNQVDIPGQGTAFSFADQRNQLLLTLDQPLFAGFRDLNAVGAAQRRVEASENGFEDQARALYADLALAFYVALEAEAQVATLQSTVEVERERLREMKARVEVGLARRTDLLLVEAQLAGDDASLERARNNLSLAREQLGFLMNGPPPERLRDSVEPPDTVPEPDATAGNDRADLRRLDALVEARRKDLAVARGAHLPTLNLAADYILSRDNYSEFSQLTDWTADLTFRLPIYEGGRTRAQVDMAHAELRQAQLDREELRRRIALQARSAWLTLQSDLAQRRTLETSLAASDESYRLASEEYRSGIATNLEVLAAQNLLLSNRLSLEEQRYRVKLDWLLLQIATGKLPATGSSR